MAASSRRYTRSKMSILVLSESIIDYVDRDSYANLGVKLMFKALIFACALATGIGQHSIALAGQPGSDWMPVEKVKEKLVSSGYTSIIRIDADDGHWDGEGIKNGKLTEFDLDPKTGEVLGETEK